MRAQFIDPMLASLVQQPPEGDEWIHEIKHDGYRSLLALENGKVQAFTRRGADWTVKYARGSRGRRVAGALGNHRRRNDVLNAEGRSDYRAFKKAIKGSPGRLVFIAFDLLMIDGKDIRSDTTIERRERLRILLDDPPAAVQFSLAMHGDGKDLYRAVDAVSHDPDGDSSTMEYRFLTDAVAAGLELEVNAEWAEAEVQIRKALNHHRLQHIQRDPVIVPIKSLHHQGA